MQYTLALTLAALAATGFGQEFTSIYNITATPEQVIGSNQVPAPGQPGALGQFNYAINSKTNTICFDITLTGVRGTYQSLARTATHIHEAVKGRSGPPRIVFPNPVGDDSMRRSVGCLTGPFTTGVLGADNVTDTGAGFTLAQIEANPAGFFTDSHTNLFVPGVVRGQLDQKFEIIEKDDDKDEDGSALTTATLTKTEEVTITQCPTIVTDCPLAPIVTKTEKVYTTICPISELPYYTKSAFPTKTSATSDTMTVTPQTTSVAVVVPVGAGTGVPPMPTTSNPAQFTGAASAPKVGGAVLAAAALVAAIL